MYLTFESHYFSIHAKPVSKFVPIYTEFTCRGLIIVNCAFGQYKSSFLPLRPSKQAKNSSEKSHDLPHNTPFLQYFAN